MRVRWLILTAMVWTFICGAVSVRAASPTITKDATIPFGQTAVTIAWDTGDGSQGQVWFEFNQTGEKLFGQGATGSQVANFLGHAGGYTFRLYKGTFTSSPKAQGLFSIAQTQQFKASPRGVGGPSVVAVQANPDGTPPVPQGDSGGFTSGPRGQILGSTSSPPGFEDNVPISATGGYPRRVYFAWDAGTMPSGAPRPAANVNVSVPVNAKPPASAQGPYQLFSQGPYGLVAFDYVVDGLYILTLTDAVTELGLTQGSFNTRAGAVTDKTTYSGGTAATVQFGFDSSTGGATVACVSNAAVGGIFANNGTIAAINNAGGGQGTITGLPASVNPYTIIVLYLYAFRIDAIASTGQNCGMGAPGTSGYKGPLVTEGTSGPNGTQHFEGSTIFTITP